MNNKNLKDCLWKQRIHKIMKIGDSVSLFIDSNIVYEAVYVP